MYIYQIFGFRQLPPDVRNIAILILESDTDYTIRSIFLEPQEVNAVIVRTTTRNNAVIFFILLDFLSIYAIHGVLHPKRHPYTQDTL